MADRCVVPKKNNSKKNWNIAQYSCPWRVCISCILFSYLWRPLILYMFSISGTFFVKLLKKKHYFPLTPSSSCGFQTALIHFTVNRKRAPPSWLRGLILNSRARRRCNARATWERWRSAFHFSQPLETFVASPVSAAVIRGCEERTDGRISISKMKDY